MKQIGLSFILCFCFLWIAAQKTVHLQTDNIHCIGNGKMAAYFSKANMIQLFGAPYSSPNLFEMMIKDESLTVESKREPGTAIWQHTIKQNQKVLGTITDFVDGEKPVLIRHFNFDETVQFTFSIASDAQIIQNPKTANANGFNNAVLVESPRGKAFYNDYPMPFRQYSQVATKGSVHISENEDLITCKKGKGCIYFIGGPLYPDCVKNSQAIFNMSAEDVLANSRTYWHEFTDRRFDFDKLISDMVPQKEKLLQTIDDVAINIKTQQATEGGVLAGHNYHMGYVRDQFGVSRCLLKLGYYEEAKSILNFYWEVWKKHGMIKNAQGMGVDAFHVHENDEVEITGYFIIQVFDYLERSNDEGFIQELFPMLEWAWNCQTKNLVKNMLPFNGDETYVAGGVLPRSALNDGSAEATMLFIAGGEKLLAWIAENNKWEKKRLKENKHIIIKVENDYRKNFIENGILYANNPERVVGLELSPFRHGVCEAMKSPNCRGFGWTQKNENNRYLCSACYTTESLEPAEPRRYNIQSVSLFPFYIGTEIFQKKELESIVGKTISSYKETGKFPSRPDGNVTVGYDYGFLLYNLTKFDHPLKDEIFTTMLSVLDETGAWVEYYDSGKPKGTRCRPWESAINLEAAIEYAQSYRP